MSVASPKPRTLGAKCSYRRTLVSITIFVLIVILYLGQCRDLNDLETCPMRAKRSDFETKQVYPSKAVVLPSVHHAVTRTTSEKRNKRRLRLPDASITEERKVGTKSESKDAKRRHRLPDAIIIGAKKAGTRALLKFLALHPNVSAAGPEMHYFDRYYNKSLDWYRNKLPMAEDHQLVIEKTPKYLVTSDAPRKIFEMNKNIKLIAVLRDPVQRALSDFTQGYSKRDPNSDRPMKLFKDQVLDGQTVMRNSQLIAVGLYARHLKKWYRYFPPEQLLLLNAESLVKSPASEMKKVQQFLGLPIEIDEDSFVYNESKSFYCLVGKQTKRENCLANGKGRKHVATEQYVLDLLYNFYEPLNRKLYSLTGIDFGWKQKVDDEDDA